MKIVKTPNGYELMPYTKEEEIFLGYLIKILQKFNELIKDDR